MRKVFERGDDAADARVSVGNEDLNEVEKTYVNESDGVLLGHEHALEVLANGRRG